MTSEGQMTLHNLVELVNQCVYCGYCSICPTYQIKNWEYYHPRGILELIRFYSDPKTRRLAESYLFEGVFACTMCKACEDICVVELPLMSIWEQVRHEAFTRGRWKKELLELYNRVKESHNIYGLQSSEKEYWIEQITTASKKRIRKKSKIGLFFGCRISYNKKLQQNALNLIKLFEIAGKNFTMMKDEWCCGSPIFLGGGFEVGKSIAQHNLEELKKRGVEQLIVSCAEGYHTFKSIYPKVLGEKWDIEVLHVTEFVLELLREGKIRFNKPLLKKITYKDPCKLARAEKLIDEPREILLMIPEINFEELRSNKLEALCCGGGGLLDITDIELAQAVNDKLVDEIVFTEAKVVLTNCPICQRFIEEGLKRKNIPIETKDWLELVIEHLEVKK